MNRYTEQTSKKRRLLALSSEKYSSQSLMNKIIEKKHEEECSVVEEDSVKVIVRIRPPLLVEPRRSCAAEAGACLKSAGASVRVCNPTLLKLNKESYWKRFDFNAVINEDQRNRDLFEHSLKPHLGSLLEGFNMSVLCYGVTGSGKTHTMFGEAEDRGLIYECAEHILRLKDSPVAGSSNKINKVQVEASIYEIYNENVRDLSFATPPSLTVCEDSKKDVYIKDLSRVNVTSLHELKCFLEAGNARRVKASTNKNLHSSRSHAIVELAVNTVGLQEGRPDPRVRSAKLMMIDLAGSERLGPSDAGYTEQLVVRKNEGAKINKSLLSLTNCILNLGDQKQFTNFRDSKLTRILKNSLSGNSKTVMIGCVSKEPADFDNTLNTLAYCAKAAFIKKKSKANVAVKTASEIEALLEKTKVTAPRVPSPNLRFFAPKHGQEKVKLKKLVKNNSSAKPTPPAAPGHFEEEKAALKKHQETPQLIELMKTMLAKKKALEDRYRRGELSSAEYFYAVASYNELSLQILNLMEAKESTATNSVLLQRTSSNKNIVPSKRAQTKSITDESEARRLNKSLRESFLLTQVRFKGLTSLTAKWNKRLRRGQLSRKAPDLSPRGAPASKSPGLFASARGSFFKSDDAMKLRLARQNYRNFKNEVQVVHSLKRSMNRQNPRETFEVACKIEALLKSQRDHKFLLTKSQEALVGELTDFLREHAPKSSSSHSVTLNF